MPTPPPGAKPTQTVAAEPLLPQAPHRNWRNVASRLALALLYLLGWSALALIHPQPSDLETYFIPAARVALDGRPLFIYSVSHQQTYPLANGPLSVGPLVVALWLAGQLGWLRSLALTKAVILAIYGVFSLLLAGEAVRVVERAAPQWLRGPRRLLVFEVFLVSLQLWQSMVYYGHVEQPLMLWLALLSVRLLGEGESRRAGVALGLALLTRTTALTVIVPLLLVLLAQRDWRALRRTGGALALTAVGGLAPFALADGPDVLYSLVTFHNSRALAGGNLWTLLGAPALAAIGQRADGVVVLLAVALVTGLTLRARPDLRIGTRECYGLLALCSLCHPAFINILWPYYFLEAFTFCALWWLAGVNALEQGGRARARWLLWGAAPLGITLLGQARQFALAQQMAAPSETPGTAMWNLLTSLALVALLATLAAYLWRPVSTSGR